MNQPNNYPHHHSNDTNGTITSYQVPVPNAATNPMYFYQKRDLLAMSESSSKSSITIPEGLTVSERDLYLRHVNASQTLDSSHNESYRLDEGHQAQDDEDDDELFLITGHIDFDAHRSSRPGSANFWKHSSELDQKTANGSEENWPKSRVEKRSVSFDPLSQEQSFNPNEEAPSFARDIGNVSSGNIQSNNAPFKQKKALDQCRETGRFHTAFDQDISEGPSEQLQKINKRPNCFFNPDISLNSELNFVNRNNLERNEYFEHSFSQYFSDESFQISDDQKMHIFPNNPSEQSASNRKEKKIERHQNESLTPMNDSNNSSLNETEEESLSKSKTGDSLKSFRAKSKSTTNICSPSTPVKSKYKSLSELSNIPTDGDDEASKLKLSFSIKDLNARLEEELSKRKKATELVEQLQNRYDNLLTKYADAEMMIDELRIGSKMAPKVSDFRSSQSPVTNLIMNRALVTSTPMASTFSMNQSLRDGEVYIIFFIFSLDFIKPTLSGLLG